MSNDSPYEYHNGELGVQVVFLIAGRNAHEQSLAIISYRGLMSRVERSKMQMLRRAALGITALVRYLFFKCKICGKNAVHDCLTSWSGLALLWTMTMG